MRAFITILLASLILTCPYICGAAEAVEGPHQHHGGVPSESSAPAHCPEDSDNCVCRGAVKAAGVRVPGGDTIGLPLPFSGPVGLLAHLPARSLTHLTCDGVPTGLAAWGDSTAVRALLQNFRC